MNEWRQSFLQKLETARKHWLQRFEGLAADLIEPVFNDFDEFTTPHGFTVSSPHCEAGTRLFKFGLTENGYVLITFHLQKLDAVDVCTEIFVPASLSFEPTRFSVNAADLTAERVRNHFEESLDRFIIAFGEASASAKAKCG